MNIEYGTKLVKFINLLTSAQNTVPSSAQADSTDKKVSVTFVTGRKYDKVLIDGEVRYFIQKIDRDGFHCGDILGAKSPLAPNPRWFFGSLDTIELWDWSAFHGKPVNDPSVREAKRGYGDYKHYERVAK
jgi:hypothetical protein